MPPSLSRVPEVTLAISIIPSSAAAGGAFGNENAMEELYAAARDGKPAKLFAVLNARFTE
jgi:hypothetical protein